MTNIEMKMNAIAKHEEVNNEEVYHEYDNVFSVGRIEYMVLNEEEVKEELEENIKNSVWAFTPSFLESMTDIDEVVFKALQDKYENGNEAVLNLIEKTCGIEEFIDEAVRHDGVGHFLSSYDGNEIELGNGLYAYRI